MLRSVVPYDDVPHSGLSKATHDALATVIRFLERKTGARMLVDEAALPFGKSELADLFELAERLRRAGVLHSLSPNTPLTDEPKLSGWRAEYREADASTAGGCSVSDERQSLVSTLAEALERHIWFERDDYFRSPLISTSAALKKPHITPDSFVGLDNINRRDTLQKSELLWIRGTSLVTNSYIWLPAQTVSAHPTLRARRKIEPRIRFAITTGLSTHEDPTRARLGGLLEIIERDAYIIMWLNQLSLPRIAPEPLAAKRPSLKSLLSMCARYRLKPTLIRMITDAPTYTFCAVVHDEAHMPTYTVGLKAGPDAAACAEGALLEALRARVNSRRQGIGTPAEPVSKEKIGHENRLLYWSDVERAKKLAFLMQGDVAEISSEPWDAESPQAHLERLVSWCREKNYSCVTVPFTSSGANVTPWHVEMIVVPELQPIDFDGHHPHMYGARISDIPRIHGYTGRAKPYTEEPHPFV